MAVGISQDTGANQQATILELSRKVLGEARGFSDRIKEFRNGGAQGEIGTLYKDPSGNIASITRDTPINHVPNSLDDITDNLNIALSAIQEARKYFTDIVRKIGEGQ